jgi:D-3-phosphoglycerate dehydrogenase
MLVVVIDPMGHDISVEAEELQRRGHNLEVLSGDGARRAHQLRTAVAVLVTDAPVDGPLLDEMPACRVAATYGVGYDNIDVSAAVARGVAVTNVPDYCTSEVADHTVAIILALLRGVVRGDAMVRDGRWSLEPFAALRRLEGLRLGLFGIGRIGRAVAERAAPFGFIMRATDPALQGEPPPGIEMVDRQELLANSDVISHHEPLGPSTKGLIDANAIERMREGTVLVNTSRGGLVDLDAALRGLAQGRLGGLGLDVYPEEPADPTLFPSGLNLVLTPHLAFYSQEAMLEGRRSAAATIADVLDGREVRNRVA